MILNLIVIVFLLLMIYWWAGEGLFSSLLHLVCVIAAGAVALAVWEPLTLSVLMERMPEYAWTVGLLAPFILVLFVFRVLLDKLVPGGVYFHQIINYVGGGLGGLFSGILTAGLVVIGIGFLPLPSEILGYQPYVIDSNGQVAPNSTSQLWLNVDQHAASFFQFLSRGVLTDGCPILLYKGDLAAQSALVRLRFDKNSSVVALPKGLAVVAQYVHVPQVPGLDAEMQKQLAKDNANGGTGAKLLIIDTSWDVVPGTFDEDRALRVPPTQVRLVTTEGGDGVQVNAPIAVSIASSVNPGRIFVPFDSEDKTGHLELKGKLGWVFLIPAENEPRCILIRNLRLELPRETKSSDEEMVQILGAPEASAKNGAGEANPPAAAGGAESGLFGTTGTVAATPGHSGSKAIGIELSDRLPKELSVNTANGLTFDATNQIVSGATESRPTGTMFVPATARVEKFQVPGHLAGVRVRIARDDAWSIWGQAKASAKMLEPIYLQDERGEQYPPIAWVLYQPSSGTQRIQVDRDNPIRAAKELPITEMNAGDELYLYFLIPRGIKLTAYHLGTQDKQDVQLDIPR